MNNMIHVEFTFLAAATGYIITTDDACHISGNMSTTFSSMAPFSNIAIYRCTVQHAQAR